ncbi:MAG TPA: hypothetical protein VF899_12665 [Pyrinomonadaceae bacterium]
MFGINRRRGGSGIPSRTAGRGEEAIAVLKDGSARYPEDRDVLLALITFNRDAGDLPTALEYAERLARIAPNGSGDTAAGQPPAE